IKDVNPKVKNGKPVIGEFSAKYASNNRLGFLPSLVVVAMAEERAFGGTTGKIIPVISSMAPVYNREPAMADQLPTNKRPHGKTPNTIRKLYDDATVARMKTERAERRGYDDPQPSKPSSGKRYEAPRDYDDDDHRPTPRFVLGRR